MRTSGTKKLQRSEITERLGPILQPWAEDADSVDQLSEGTNLVADLGLDSVGILNVILGVEKEFNISISEQELDSETFLVLRNLVSLIEEKHDAAD